MQPADPAGFGLALTLAVWGVAVALSRRIHWLNPVLTTTAAIIVVLLVANVSYADYRSGTDVLVSLIAPAVVALALPVVRMGARIGRAMPWVVLIAVGGGTIGVSSTVLIAWALGVSRDQIIDLAGKHATSPVSAAIAGQLGGSPSLAAVLAILTGVLGASLGPLVLRLFSVRDSAVRGLLYGVTAHSIGTSRAIHEGEETAGFSAIGMALSALIVPVLVLGTVALFL